MENTFFNMELRQFKELFPPEQMLAIDDDFCIVDARYDQKLTEFKTPVRLDAYLALFCIKGRIRLSVNMKEFSLGDGQLALMIPGYIGQLIGMEVTDTEDMHYVMIGMSRQFLSALHLDLKRIFSEWETLLENPCVTLTEEEKAVGLRYLELGSIILNSGTPRKRESVGALLSSLFYLSEGIFNQRMDQTHQTAVLRSNRAENVLNKFLRLLADYHTQERRIGFYADKLCLSPKYFSKLVKLASGRSAPEWIDTYVILEAKNYLKYSDMSIKQIVHELSFTDQPTFTKFFKSHTGMTPGQFRRS